MEVEEKIAQDIMKAVTRLGLPLRLDKITEGRGNCFPLALIAQCKRKEILGDLPRDVQRLILEECPTKLRQAVTKYMRIRKTDIVTNYKARFEEIVTLVDGKTWLEYWDTMSQDQE